MTCLTNIKLQKKIILILITINARKVFYNELLIRNVAAKAIIAYNEMGTFQDATIEKYVPQE